MYRKFLFPISTFNTDCFLEKAKTVKNCFLQKAIVFYFTEQKPENNSLFTQMQMRVFFVVYGESCNFILSKF